jgi:hypothetical protein
LRVVTLALWVKLPMPATDLLSQTYRLAHKRFKLPEARKQLKLLTHLDRLLEIVDFVDQLLEESSTIAGFASSSACCSQHRPSMSAQLRTKRMAMGSPKLRHGLFDVTSKPFSDSDDGWEIEGHVRLRGQRNNH